MKLIHLTFNVAAFGVLVGISIASGLVVQGPAGQIEFLKFPPGGIYVTESLNLGSVPDGGRILAAADFDGNGSAELVLEYDPDASGPRPNGTFLWRYEGQNRIGVTQLGGVATGYSVPVGTCDLDHDGNWEFMMWNPDNKSVKITEIFQTAPYAGGERTILAGGRDSFGMVAGICDMDEDGDADEILLDPATKNFRYRYLNRTNGHSISIVSPDGPLVGRLAGAFKPLPGSVGLIIDSPDGIAPRQYVNVRDVYIAGVLPINRDNFKSWPIVAIVP